MPEDPEGEMEENDDMSRLAADFEIGHLLRDSVIPKAVLYYTGEVGDEDDDDVRPSFPLSNEFPSSLVRRRRRR